MFISYFHIILSYSYSIIVIKSYYIISRRKRRRKKKRLLDKDSGVVASI